MDGPFEFESMADMTKRLAGSGAGAQANAVLQAIQQIQAAPGVLDELNRAAALYHLAVALTGVPAQAASALETAAHLAREAH